MRLTMPTAALRPPPTDRPGLLDRKATVGALALGALMLLMVLSGAKWEQIDRIAGLSNELRARETAKSRLHEAEVRIVSMQSARSGFVLTGGEGQAQRFEAAASEVQEDLTALRELIVGVGDPRALAADVDALRVLLREYESQLRESIQAYRREPEESELRTRYTVAGQAMYKRIQAALQAIETAIERQFALDAQALTQGLGLAQRLEAVLFACAAASLLAALALAWRQTVRRDHALSELEAAHQGLEQEVQRRTADLDRALERYRSLVELSEDAILMCEPDRRIQYANPAAKALFGSLGHRDIVGMSLERLLAPGRRASLLRALDGLAQGAPRLGFVATALMGPDAAQCPVELAAASIGSAETEAPHTLVMLHDLRLHTAQQAALHEQIEFVEHLVEGMPLSLSLQDSQGRFTRVNRAFEALHGVDRRALVGHLAAEVLSAAQAGSLLVPPLAADGLQAVGVVEHEASWRGGDGHEHVVQVRQQALRRQGASGIVVLSVQTDVTALRQHERELRQHRDRLGELATQLIASQEKERRHVARELHDQVGQILTALHMQLAARNAGAAAGTLDGPIELAEEALRHTRDLTASLHPHMLDDLGLKAALNGLLNRYILPTLGEVEFSCELAPERADPAIELVVFRVVQEALTNVVRHAKASCAEVGLRTGEGWLRLDVADDGEGFSAGDTWFDRGRQTSIGVASMRERVEDLGGEFDIDSAPGLGTRLRVLLPWPSLTTHPRGAHASPAG